MAASAAAVTASAAAAAASAATAECGMPPVVCRHHGITAAVSRTTKVAAGSRGQVLRPIRPLLLQTRVCVKSLIEGVITLSALTPAPAPAAAATLTVVEAATATVKAAPAAVATATAVEAATATAAAMAAAVTATTAARPAVRRPLCHPDLYVVTRRSGHNKTGSAHWRTEPVGCTAVPSQPAWKAAVQLTC